jgi:hypothetical protein
MLHNELWLWFDWFAYRCDTDSPQGYGISPFCYIRAQQNIRSWYNYLLATESKQGALLDLLGDFLAKTGFLLLSGRPRGIGL